MRFSVARLPRIEFGAGTRELLPSVAAQYGRRLLLVTGGRSFSDSEAGCQLIATLLAQGFQVTTFQVAGEPSPRLVDGAVARWREAAIDAVVGIGGGSVLDAAKAIAGLLKPGNSVMDHLEGVGPEKRYSGPSTPFIAMPTTAGTGSEATKNAVLSDRGENGFKKSFRDDRLVAEYAIVDPDLLAGCPPPLVAANGTDAFTQLLESFVSLRASPLTDALALSGIRAVRDGLVAWYEGGEGAAAGREKMAYAALLSGICLAQAGLGSVHGLASPLGALFPIPHGVACGTLLAAATRCNIEVMRQRDPANVALAKYAEVGRLFRGRSDVKEDEALDFLVETLQTWTRRLDLPTLGALGVESADLPRIVADCRGSSMKTNPVELTDAEVSRLLEESLG
jgi:alcohol dehydrogenase class IV